MDGLVFLYRKYNGEFDLDNVLLTATFSMMNSLIFIPPLNSCNVSDETKLMIIRMLFLVITAAVVFAITNRFIQKVLLVNRGVLLKIIVSALIAVLIYTIFASLTIVVMAGIEGIGISSSTVLSWLKNPFQKTVTMSCRDYSIDFHLLELECIGLMIFWTVVGAFSGWLHKQSSPAEA